MRPPRMPPPRTQNTVPWPWSVPRLPFSRKVRPNSLISTTTVSCHAGPCSSAKAASPRPSSSSRVARKPLAPPSPTCVSQPPTSTKPTLNCSFINFATRRASTSKPRALTALRPAPSISPIMSRMTSSRIAKPSLTCAARGVPRYMAVMSALWRASTAGLPTNLRPMFATCASPRNTRGSWSVKAMARGRKAASLAPSTDASRLRNPDWKLCASSAPWPSSMASCVSKWLRLRSSVPANGMKAACPFWYSL